MISLIMQRAAHVIARNVHGSLLFCCKVSGVQTGKKGRDAAAPAASMTACSTTVVWCAACALTSLKRQLFCVASVLCFRAFCTCVSIVDSESLTSSEPALDFASPGLCCRWRQRRTLAVMLQTCSEVAPSASTRAYVLCRQQSPSAHAHQIFAIRPH